METSEIIKTESFPTIVFDVLQKNCPETRPVFFDENPPFIILNGPGSIKLGEVIEDYFEHPIGKVPPKGYEALEGSTAIDIGARGLTHLEHCIEVESADGKRVYIVFASEYEKIQQQGICKKNERMEELLRRWRHDAIAGAEIINPDQFNAERALSGVYGSIVPVLTGLKPVGSLKNTTWRNTITLLSKEQIDFFERLTDVLPGIEMLRGANPNEFIFFNTDAVKRVVQENPDIFSKLNIDESMPAKKIVSQVYIHETRQDAAFHAAVGLLYGYDKTSVMKFTNGEPPSPHYNFNLWSVMYTIYDREINTDFQKLLLQYQKLQQWIEEQLERGLSPFEILKLLPSFSSSQEILLETRAKAEKVLP